VQRARDALAQAAPALVVVGRRQVRSNNSWMHNLPVLAKGPFRCTALIHPDDARRAGLQASPDGHLRARLAHGAKSIEVEVEVSAEMMPGVISLPHGWGHDLAGAKLSLAAERPGVNLNALLDENARDPLSGNAVLSGVPVTMVPSPSGRGQGEGQRRYAGSPHPSPLLEGEGVRPSGAFSLPQGEGASQVPDGATSGAVTGPRPLKRSSAR
jgi:hypothetical protein